MLQHSFMSGGPRNPLIDGRKFNDFYIITKGGGPEEIAIHISDVDDIIHDLKEFKKVHTKEEATK